MLRLDRIEHLDTLRQAALLLESTVVRQQQTIARLERRLAQLEGSEAPPAQLELESLQRQIAGLQKALYGPTSEKRPSEAPEASPRPEPEPRRGHGPKAQPSLPIVEVEHVVDGEPPACPACGGATEAMAGQFEEAEEITVVVPQYALVRHRRQKYRCRCNGAIVTAPGPPKLVAGGRYSLEFAVHVAERKYLDHLPLARQQREMERRDLIVDRQTLWDQLVAAAEHLGPSYAALRRFVLESEQVYADETSWPLLGAQNGSPRWWAWCVARDEAVVYRILPSRSQAAAARVLAGYQGYVMTDGYAAYQALARAGPGLELVHCWSHVRRKFLECEDAYPAESGEALRRIGALFGVEQSVPPLAPGADEAQSRQRWELLARLRREQSRPEIDALRDWAYATKPRVLPKSGIGQAIDYLLSLWAGLTKFLADPRIPLTNNAAERALRGPVVGRKNHYGSRSKKGTEVAALFYSLFESAKLAGVDPYLYVLTALRRAIKAPGTATLPADLRATPET